MVPLSTELKAVVGHLEINWLQLQLLLHLITKLRFQLPIAPWATITTKSISCIPVQLFRTGFMIVKGMKEGYRGEGREEKTSQFSQFWSWDAWYQDLFRDLTPQAFSLILSRVA